MEYPFVVNLLDSINFKIESRDHLEHLFIHYQPELSSLLCSTKQSLMPEHERLDYVLHGLRNEFDKVIQYSWNEYVDLTDHFKIPEESYFVNTQQ